MLKRADIARQREQIATIAAKYGIPSIHLIWERNETPQMTQIGTDQGRKRESESAFICAICGSKRRNLGEEKAFAGFDPTGHSGIHIQSALSIPSAPPSLTP